MTLLIKQGRHYRRRDGKIAGPMPEPNESGDFLCPASGILYHPDGRDWPAQGANLVSELEGVTLSMEVSEDLVNSIDAMPANAKRKSGTLAQTMERINQEAIVSILQSLRPSSDPTAWSVPDQVYDTALSEAILAVRNRALPRTSGVPEAEAVHQLMALKEWAIAIVQSVRPSTKHRWDEKDSAVDAALCDAILAIRNAVPPPVVAPSGEASAWSVAQSDWVRRCAQKVIDETNRNLEERPWPIKYGACYGALAELAKALTGSPLSPIASEPNDAGISEALRKMLALFDEQGNIIAGWSAIQYAVQAGYEALSPAVHRAKAKGGIKILSDEEEIAMLTATDQLLSGSLAIVALDNLHAAGFSITRTAPSGVKPGEMG